VNCQEYYVYREMSLTGLIRHFSVSGTMVNGLKIIYFIGLCLRNGFTTDSFKQERKMHLWLQAGVVSYMKHTFPK